MSKKIALERLLRPKSVAVFGGDDAAVVVHQCQLAGFDGDIWAVNPHRAELGGISCVASVADLPAVPDASFVAAPPQASLDIIRDLAARGATGAVCYAAGFAETGAGGVKMQQQLQADSGDMAIIGPNCHGYLNYLDGVALWPDQHGGQAVDRGVAIVLQSGNIGINLTMQQRGLDIAYVISVGNKSSVGLHEYIGMLISDSRVTAIGLHIEGIENIAAFSDAAIKSLRKGVPIVAIKTGRSSRGAEITMSHTGSLAGSDAMYSALFQRVGIARCDTLAQFLETLKFVSTVGTLPDNTVASMSCSGGEASLVADCADSMQIRMPPLNKKSINKLQAILGPNVDVLNPLDYHMYVWGNYENLNACFVEVLKNGFACTMLVLDYPPADKCESQSWEIAEQALIDAVASTGQRAVIVASLPEALPAEVRRRLQAAGITPMQGLEDCLFAIRAAAVIGKAQRRADMLIPVLEPTPLCSHATSLNEWQSKQELAEFGLPTPAGRICAASETGDAADALGYPVVLKAVSSDLSHKSDAGAVAINLGDRDAVQIETERMTPQFDRFLVEEMVQSSIAELIIGVNRDPTFGLTLLLGAGGTLVELLDDTMSLLLPVQRHEIEAAIASLKISKLIEGYRGDAAGDSGAVVDAVEAIARYAISQSESLVELDVNPLLVMPDGAIAVDAFIRKTTSGA